MMSKQLTVQDLYDMLGVMLGEGIDPDTPVVALDNIDEYDEVWHMAFTSLYKGDATYHDYKLQDIVTRDVVILD